ncbi:MAG: replicative DNA helicase [Lachnospiraceae bacterium]|nr:replicative DNA helicase [Lachnospiraceae bacterium]
MAEEAMVKRTRPHMQEAEEAVLGGLYIDNEQIAAIEDVLPDGKAFYNKTYGTIYDAMVALNKKGMAVDMVTLQSKLSEMNVPPEVVSPEFLQEVIMKVPTSANVRHYANIVAQKALLRDLLSVSEEISEACYEDRDDVNEILEKAEKKVFDVVQRRNLGDIRGIDQIVMDTLKLIDKAARTEGDVTGLSTGFIDLDKKTAGFQPGNLVLVAARPAMGKTSFVLSIAKNLVINQHKKVLMFSLEMVDTELANRLLSMDSKVDSQKFKTGSLTEGDWESIVESGGNYAHSGLILHDRATTLPEIRSISRKMKVERNIDLVIIDYLQLMNSASKKADSRQQEISEISRGLKLLAKELQVPIIALSQLSRGVESRNDHRPMLSDLRESGAIEQDADVVLFIYRDEVYNADTEDKNIAEIIIAKQRSGPIGTVKLAWLAEYTQFGNLGR